MYAILVPTFLDKVYCVAEDCTFKLLILALAERFSIINAAVFFWAFKLFFFLFSESGVFLSSECQKVPELKTVWSFLFRLLAIFQGAE